MWEEIIVGIVSGLISGTIVSLLFDFSKEMKESKKLHSQFSIEAINLIDKLSIYLGKDINHDLLKCFLLGENSITQEELNSEMLKMINIRNKISLREINNIYERYNVNYVACILYKSRKKEMNNIVSEIEELLKLIAIQCSHFERHLKENARILKCSELNKTQKTMFYFLSKIYKKTHKIEQEQHFEKICRIWYSNIEYRILIFFKKINKNQDAVYEEKVASYIASYIASYTI